MRFYENMQKLLSFVLIGGLAFGGAFVWTALQYMEQIKLPLIYMVLGTYAFISINYAMLKEIIK